MSSQAIPTIFITGAAAGIGKACAEHFHQAGWFVGLYDVDLAGCERLRDELGSERAAAGELNVTNPEQWRTALESFWSAAGQRLDLLLNNAGILRSGPFENVPLEQQHLEVDINFKGVMNGCHTAFPYLKRTKGSRVINLASASAIYGQPDIATYSATKFAVRGLTEALDIEWQAHGIKVMDIWPIFVQTSMIGQLDKASSVDNMGVNLTPSDVAQTVLRAARYSGLMPKVHWHVGAMTTLSYYAMRLLPAWLNRLIVKHISAH